MQGKVTKPCKHCGEEFASWDYKNKIFCSAACWRKHQRGAGTCPTCGKEFTYKLSRPKTYCSVKCSPGRPPTPGKNITTKCPVCGKEFRQHKSENLVTCSIECRDKHFHPDATATTECPECGKEFTYYKSWPRKYCSHECSGKNTVANIPNWKPTAYESTCEQCGKKYTTTPERTNGRFCSLVCWGKWQEIHAPRGEDHPNWRGGYSPYYGENWREQRRAARRRDNHTCRECGITEHELGRKLDVHHIRRFGSFSDYREANSLDNLISLCNKCHTAVEWNGL